MSRHVAFLRAINVGGHVVKMDALHRAFESLGLANVETFIASGNVLFDARSGSRALEKKIEAHLQKALGYRVDTFIRSAPEIAAIAEYEPFKGRTIDGATVYVALLGVPPGAEAQLKIEAFQTADEAFHIHGRELYWQRVPSMRVATFSGALLERTLRGPATMRNVNTIRRLAAKLACR
jgi:uncharacterized protein (DUF1697 family)